MFTYQLIERVSITENGKEFSFPNVVELEIFLGPSEMFGVGDKLTRTIECGCNTELYLDLNTGKYGFVLGRLPEPIDVIVDWYDEKIRFEMHGN